MAWITSQIAEVTSTAERHFRELVSEQPGLTHLAQLLSNRIEVAARNPYDRAAWEGVEYRVDELELVETAREGCPKRTHLIREVLRRAYTTFAQLERERESPRFLRGDEEELYTTIGAA